MRAAKRFACVCDKSVRGLRIFSTVRYDTEDVLFHLENGETRRGGHRDENVHDNMMSHNSKLPESMSPRDMSEMVYLYASNYAGDNVLQSVHRSAHYCSAGE